MVNHRRYQDIHTAYRTCCNGYKNTVIKYYLACPETKTIHAKEVFLFYFHSLEKTVITEVQ